MNMPCFPSKKPFNRVVKPEDTVPHKNVHRYGETQIRHVGQPLRRDQWKKGGIRDPNEGRPLPDTPREHLVEERVVRREHHQLQQRAPEVEVEREERAVSARRKPPIPKYNQPLTSDFYISVPIFNETLSHSYRKKNEYVYVDRDDDVSLYHQSLSRASSLRDLRQDSARTSSLRGTRQDTARRPHSGHREYYVEKRRPKSLQRYPGREQRRRPLSGSEASYNTYSSRGTYGYESETFEEARHMRSGPRSGLSIDSDEEDCR